MMHVCDLKHSTLHVTVILSLTSFFKVRAYLVHRIIKEYVYRFSSLFGSTYQRDTFFYVFLRFFSFEFTKNNRPENVDAVDGWLQVIVCCRVLQCVAVCCMMIWFLDDLICICTDVHIKLQVIACCNVLQCVVVCCKLLHFVVTCCSVLHNDLVFA